jgi:hypothetical protein
MKLPGQEGNPQEIESRMGNTSGKGSPGTVIRDLTTKLARMDSLLDRRDERMHLEWEHFISLASMEKLLKAWSYLCRESDSMVSDLLLIVDWLEGQTLRGTKANRGRQRRRATRSPVTPSPKVANQASFLPD